MPDDHDDHDVLSSFSTPFLYSVLLLFALLMMDAVRGG